MAKNDVILLDGIIDQRLAEGLPSNERDEVFEFLCLEQLLKDYDLSRDEIECIAVGLGPGSYAGIRIAIAIAQGWQLARGVKLLGISSAECLAAQAQGIFGRVNVVIDAQRGEFYLATWEISAAARAEIAPLKIVTAAEIAARKLAGEICAGPAVDPVLFPSAGMLARLADEQNL